MKNEKEKIIALIPARAGSKGIANKNLVELGGKPLFYYTVQAALTSKLVDEVWVSSDSLRIIEMARGYGCQAVRRPSAISADATPMADVVLHFIHNCICARDGKSTYIVLLQPTSPFRSVKSLDEALEIFLVERPKALTSLRENRFNPFKSATIDEHGKVRPLFQTDMSNVRRQDIPVTYSPNGAIYIFSANDFIKQKDFFFDGSRGYVMSDSESIDIDTKDDLAAARKLLSS